MDVSGTINDRKLAELLARLRTNDMVARPILLDIVDGQHLLVEACVAALDLLAVLLFAVFGQRVLCMCPIESILRLVGSVWLLWL